MSFITTLPKLQKILLKITESLFFKSKCTFIKYSSRPFILEGMFQNFSQMAKKQGTKSKKKTNRRQNELLKLNIEVE